MIFSPRQMRSPGRGEHGLRTRRSVPFPGIPAVTCHRDRGAQRRGSLGSRGNSVEEQPAQGRGTRGLGKEGIE